VTKARNLIDAWFRQNGNLMLPFLAFAIPLIVRAIPEVLMGQYLVGFDTVGYYVPNTLQWLRGGVSFSALLSSAPLFYILLMGLTSIGAPIVISLKIFGPLILGLLGFTIYFYANKALSWSPRKSLLVTLLATLNFVALRISWDMFRSEIATILLFIALIFLAKNKLSLKNGILLSVSMLLIVLAHQLVTVIMFVVVIAAIARLYFGKRKIELGKLLVISVPAIVLFLTIIYINYFIYSLPFLGTSITTSSGLPSLATTSYLTAVVDTLGFFVFCFLPLIPLLILGARYFKSNLQLKAWMIWTAIPVVLAILVPSGFVGGVFPYRWIMLLTYPLAFVSIEGLFRIKWKWPKIAVGIIIVLLVGSLSAGFLVEQNNTAFEYFGTYPSYIPKSMLQNTVPASDCEGTVNALVWAQNNMPSNGRLLVHEAFYGWGMLYFNSSQLLPYGFLNPQDIAQQQHNATFSNPLYLIWWVNGTGWYGQPTTPSSFQEIYHSGNIAIYNYSDNK
jgi:hypothetical protein